MKRIIINTLRALALIIFIGSTFRLITTGNQNMIIVMIYSAGLTLVYQWGLLKGWYTRAILDNSMPITDDYVLNIEKHDADVKRLLTTDLGSLDKYYTNKLHRRSINKKAAWDKVLAIIQPDQTN
jgi:hypothetical protein